MVRKLLVAASTLTLVFASVAGAGVPDPTLSIAPTVLVTPGGSLAYEVVVNSTAGPVSGALVQLVFGSEADGLICWCPTQTHPVVDATTNASGVASFLIAAGGCINPALTATLPAVEVFADGIKLAEVGVVSPDAVDGGGTLPTAGWDPVLLDGGCAVGLSDASFHTGPFANSNPEFCSDMDGSGGVGLNDAVIATQAISSGEFCAGAPGAAPSGPRD